MQNGNGLRVLRVLVSAGPALFHSQLAGRPVEVKLSGASAEGVVAAVLNGAVEEVIDLVASGRTLNCALIGGVEEVEGGIAPGVLVCGGAKNE